MKYYLVNIFTENVVERFSLKSRTADENEETLSKVCAVFGYTTDSHAIDRAERNDKGDFPKIDNYINLY